MHSALRSFLTLIILCFVGIGSALAVNPDEVLSDPALENRARNLSAQIRCVVCQNQSIDDSDAPLARDLRLLVREKLVEGYKDQQIFDHLVARYGEFVLLRPRFGLHTVALWLLPLLLLVVGGWAAFRMFSGPRISAADSVALSDEEKARLDKLLDQ